MVLSPHDILARLAPRLELLTSGPRDASARHQTLRHAIDWSYDLLTDDERGLLRRLSTFAGSFTVEAAEAVAAPSGEAVIECLSSLVGKSLVRVAPGRAGTESRFSLLETIREYAHERLLREGDASLAHLRHAEHFRDVVEREYPRNFGPEQPALAARLERDYPNLRAALTWALDTGHVELALRPTRLALVLVRRGQLVEDALAGPGPATVPPGAARPQGRRHCGRRRPESQPGQIWRGDRGSSRQRWRSACAARQTAARSELAMALGILGVAQIAAVATTPRRDRSASH
jgi:hypothetical protein